MLCGVESVCLQLMRHQRRILLITDNYPRNALTPRVSVERVALLLDVLSLSGFRAFRDGFAKEGHEFADGGAGEAGVGGEVALGGEFDGGFGFVLEDLSGEEVSVVVEEGSGEDGRRCRGASWLRLMRWCCCR